MALPADRPPARRAPKRGRPRTKHGAYRATSLTVENSIFDATKQFCLDTNISLSAYFEALAAADLRARGRLP